MLIRIRGALIKIKFIIFGIINLPSYIIFGNSAGYLNNILSIRDINKIIKYRNFNRISQQTIYLVDNGYYIFELPQKDLIYKIKNQVDDCLNDPSKFYYSNNGKSKIIKNSFRIDGIIELLRGVDNIIREYYCGKSYKIKSIRIWQNLSVDNIKENDHDVFSNTFHCDNYKISGLRVFYYLNDGVNRDTGAFRFHSKPNTQSIMKSFGYLHRAITLGRMKRKITNPLTLKYFEGGLGSAAIVNTQQCLHAASVPKMGSYRNIIQFEIYPDFKNQRNLEDIIISEKNLIFY